MTPYEKTLKGFIAAILLLLCVNVSINAQTTAEMISDSDNSVVFRIDNLSEDQKPTKILLVYDSNLITLESTSRRARFFRTKSNIYNAPESYRKAMALSSTLAVEYEQEQEIEDWMLQPFESNKGQIALLTVDKEEEMEVEDWMTNLNSW
jgi:hypothetical protein